GNGGSANSWGTVYNPDGTPVSSGSSGGSGSQSGTGNSGSSTSGSSGGTAGSGTSGTGSQTISAEDLRNLANSGRPDSITKLFPTGEDETAKTFFMNLSAEDFGIPEDGYMILSLDSDGFAGRTGSHWDDTRYVSDADGMIHFIDIPMMRVGSHVTVIVLCYAADGTLISSGYSSGVAKENGVPMEISILGSARIVLGSNSAPNGSTVEHDGTSYDVIEYTGTGLEMAAVNTTAASTMEVKINGVTMSTTTEQSFTANLADGYNAIEVTVTKGSNEPIVIRRNIYVLRQFTRPVIALGSNGTANGRTATGTDGRTYDVIEYTGSNLGVTVTNGFEGTATFDVQINGSSVGGTPVTGPAMSVTQTLADGFNAITATLTESVCGSVTEERCVYVVKKLVKPVITQSGGTPGSGTVTSGGKSYQIIEYTGATLPTVTASNSYADTASASFTVTLNGSPVSGSATSASAPLAAGCNTVVASLSRDHCVTQTETKYFYVTKPLVAPVITRGGSGALNSKTATVGGRSYTVIEYDGTGATRPNITATNSYDGTGAEFTVTLNSSPKSGTPASVTTDLVDGANAVVATLSNTETGVSVKDEKYFYVVKKLVKPTVTYSDGILTNEAADAGGYHMLRYSYLADPIVMPKFSVTNPYSDGTVSMSVSVDGGTPLVGAVTTGDISSEELTDGAHTITITLSKDYCTDLVVTKKIKVAIKAVKVQISGQVHVWASTVTISEGVPKIPGHELYIEAENADGEDAGAKTCFTATDGTEGRTADGEIAANFSWTTDSTKNYVYLTAPASTFYFYTNTMEHRGGTGPSLGRKYLAQVVKGNTDVTCTLADLKSVASKDFDTGELDSSGNPASTGRHASYRFTISRSEVSYTAGTDDEPPPSP
ncbi:MAG: hypothetical protein J6Y13_05155, partial [Treponema sp.]|nr:hypothetical protein [Treponema sp.]